MTQATYHVDETEREISHQLVIDPSQSLELNVSNVHGRIAVRGADRKDVLVQATKHGRSDSKVFERARLRIQADGNVINVHPDYGSHLSFGGDTFDLDVGLELGRDIARDVVKGLFGKRSEADRESSHGERVEPWDDSGRPRYDIAIEVPRSLVEGSRVVLRTASGPMDCMDLQAHVDASSASGDLHLHTLRGPVTVQTASGELHAERISGRLTFRSASGDARITDCDLTGLNVNTASGDINLQGRLAAADGLRVHTVSGDVDLELVDPVPSEITFKSVSGDARIGMPYQPVGQKTWKCGPDGSHGRLAVKTVSGDLVVRVRAASGSGERESGFSTGEPVPPTTPVPPAPSVPPAPPVPASEVSAGSTIVSGGPAGNGAHPWAPESGAPDEASEAERLSLLQALERGEIDVDDAMRRLDELDDGGDASNP